MNRDEPATDDCLDASTGDHFESLLALYDQALFDQALASDTAGEAGSTQSLDQPLEPRLARAQQCLRLLYGRWPGARASDAASDPMEPGHSLTFGRFQVERELGRGGYGVVYLAYDPILRREIALKLPRPEVLAGGDSHQRFVREGQTAARLHDPNLVTVLEAGDVGPVCYLAMEYCPGETLSAWRKAQEQPIAPRLAAELLLPLAEAVGYLHTQGVVHRDIKPGNVLLEQSHHPNPLPKGEGIQRCPSPKWRGDLV